MPANTSANRPAIVAAAITIVALTIITIADWTLLALPFPGFGR